MTFPAPAQAIHPDREPKRRVLVSSTSSDSHTWNLVFLQILLEDMGHEVINIGSCVPDDLLIEQARRHRPDMVVISSVNGHGALDGKRLITRVRAHLDLAELPVVIGGKLDIKAGEGGQAGPELMRAGFTAVFEDSQGIDTFRDYLALTGRRRVLEATG